MSGNGDWEMVLPESSIENGAARIIYPPQSDLYVTPMLKDLIVSCTEEEAVKELTLDLSQVVFLDTVALSTMIKAVRHTRENGLELKTEKPSDKNVLKIFEITGLDRIFWPSGPARRELPVTPDIQSARPHKRFLSSLSRRHKTTYL